MTKRNGCPICGKPSEAEFAPFCSRGCKDRDLLQWLGEGYRIPAEPVDPNAQTGLDTDRDAD
ncbi:DNA gyrase inhibitor YacG [Sphingomonas sp. MMS12-HWE2-04]|uniref:DNA gyrase inhibitor YacG n=1 Tax=Sphingomonas sp. MMS12-HWE2-04 TaxID=3234199 RepID=UPI0038507CEB